MTCHYTSAVRAAAENRSTLLYVGQASLQMRATFRKKWEIALITCHCASISHCVNNAQN